MKYELVVSDFDWTLGLAPDIIDEGTVKAIEEYKNKGGKFAIITGRMSSSIRGVCEKYNIKGIVSSYQGGVITDLETGKVLFSGGMDYQLASKILEKYVTEDVRIAIFIDDVLYYNINSPYIEMFKNNPYVKMVNEPDLISLVNRTKKKVTKINLILSSEEAVEPFIEKYKNVFGSGVIINSGGPYLVETLNADCSKGHAVRFLAEYYNIPLAKVMAVGDSLNDIELLDGEWHGVATGDANEILKKYAKEITVPFKEHPVKILLEKYCL